MGPVGICSNGSGICDIFEIADPRPSLLGASGQ